MSALPSVYAPYLKPWWRITCEATRVTFHYGDDAIVCEGRSVAIMLPQLVPLMDGRHTVDAMINALGPTTGPFVHKIVDLFASRGMLVDGKPVPVELPPAGRETVHFIAATQPRSETLAADAHKLVGLRVGVVGDSHVAREVARSIEVFGASAPRLTWNASLAEIAATDVVLVAPSAAELPLLAQWNALALDAQARWFSVLPFDGKFAAVGPLYIPGETACYECFRHRRAANVSYAAQWWAMQETPAPYPSPLPVELTLAGLTSLALLRWHLRSDPGLPGSFLALEINGEIALTSHVVYRVPRCKACANVHHVAPVLPWFEARAWSA